MPTASREVVDLSELKDNVGGQMPLISKLVEHIRQSLPQAMGELRRAVNAGDAERVQRLAHGLKSPLGNFGATKARNLAHQLELWGNKGDMHRCLALLVCLEDEVQRIVDYFSDPSWQERI